MHAPRDYAARMELRNVEAVVVERHHIEENDFLAWLVVVLERRYLSLDEIISSVYYYRLLEQDQLVVAFFFVHSEPRRLHRTCLVQTRDTPLVNALTA